MAHRLVWFSEEISKRNLKTAEQALPGPPPDGLSCRMESV
jgi:hypothetical protein